MKLKRWRLPLPQTGRTNGGGSRRSRADSKFRTWIDNWRVDRPSILTLPLASRDRELLPRPPLGFRTAPDRRTHQCLRPATRVVRACVGLAPPHGYGLDPRGPLGLVRAGKTVRVRVSCHPTSLRRIKIKIPERIRQHRITRHHTEDAT